MTSFAWTKDLRHNSQGYRPIECLFFANLHSFSGVRVGQRIAKLDRFLLAGSRPYPMLSTGRQCVYKCPIHYINIGVAH